MVDASGALLICGAFPASTTSTLMNGQRSNRPSMLSNYGNNNNEQQLSRIHDNNNSFHGMDDDHTALAGSSSATTKQNVLRDSFAGDDHDDGGDAYGAGWANDGPDDDYEGFQTIDEAAQPMQIATPAKGQGPNQHSAAKANKAAAPARIRKDMFAQLDPHQPASTTSRAVRKGKTYKVPSALLQPRVGAEPRLEFLYEGVQQDNNLETLLSTGAVPSKGLFDSSLFPLLQLKRKMVRQARMANMREQQQKLIPLDNHSGDEATEQFQNLRLHQQVNNGANESRVEELWTQDYADYHSDGGGDYGGFADNGAGADDVDDYEGQSSNVNNGAAAFGDAAVGLSGGLGGEGHDFEDNWGFPLSEEEELARRVASVLSEDMNQQSTRSTYENICQKYIDNFNQGAHMFAK